MKFFTVTGRVSSHQSAQTEEIVHMTLRTRISKAYWRALGGLALFLCVAYGTAVATVTVVEGPAAGRAFVEDTVVAAAKELSFVAKAGWEKSKDWCRKQKERPRKESDNDRPKCRVCPTFAYLYKERCYLLRFGRPRPQDAFLPAWCGRREEKPVLSARGLGNG